MLALLGLLTVVALLAAIMSKRVSPLVALIVVPVRRGARRRVRAGHRRSSSCAASGTWRPSRGCSSSPSSTSGS